MWMLAPAAATVIAAVALVYGLRTVALASADLAGALRKSSSAAVASDEASRLVTRLGDHAEATRASADRLRADRMARSGKQPRTPS